MSVSSNIDTMMSNVQSAAAEMNAEVLGGVAYIMNYLPDKAAFGVPPAVSQLPTMALAEPTELYDMLSAAAASLKGVGDAIPPMSTLAGQTTSQALETFMDYVDDYRNKLKARMALVSPVLARAFPVSGFVQSEAGKVDSRWSPVLAVPGGVATAFSTEVITRLSDYANVTFWKAKLEEMILQSNVDATVAELNAKRALQESALLLAFANTALQGAYAILRKTIVSPTDVLAIFNKLSSARTKVATGLSENRVAYANTEMEYINALLGYYDVYGDLEKVRLESNGLLYELDAEYDGMKATMLVGAASAAAQMAAAGYSATRVSIALTDKAFS